MYEHLPTYLLSFLGENKTTTCYLVGFYTSPSGMIFKLDFGSRYFKFLLTVLPTLYIISV